ncbi:cholecystokinin receptor-like [Mizuhopecten yessoensis]|uniref:cholecystokinin receptor-like n=1 Tax=Mizuhopecten yessoensis TaxID=6573 RepID=UPI000B4593F4|nr:cholecystokinin receptor-like [Mizuhopecten yessoensis]
MYDMNTTEITPKGPVSVDDWNEEISTRLLPDSIVLMTYLVVGVLGNSAVLYIYTIRLKGNIDDRFFIPALAFVDLMTCTLGTSSSFTVNMLPVRLESGVACKIIHFFPMTFSAASAYLLLLIAVNRYMKICKPFNKQITVYWKKVTLILVACSSVLLSWPCFLFYGSKEIIHDGTKITGTRCTSIRGPWSTIEPLIFKSAVFLVLAVIIFALVTLYILIGRTIFKQRNFRRKLCVNQTPISSQQVTESNADFTILTTVSVTNTQPSSESTSPTTEVTVIASNQRQIHRDSGQSPEVRLTLIFMLITFAFVICYVPKVALMVYESRNEHFWIELDKAEMGGYRFLYTLIYVNSIVNPIIYGFFDRRFRREARVTLRTCKRRCLQ